MKRFLILPILLAILGTNVFAHSQKVESSKERTSVVYTLVHPLHTIEATSKDAVFHAEIDTSARSISSVSATVDVTTFDSGNSNRDSHAMEVIDAIDYPDVTFSSTRIMREGGGDTLDVTGNLTFHGITKAIAAVVVPTWSASRLTVRCAFNISFTDFKIDRPSLLMIPVKDTLKFSLTTEFPLK